MNNEDFAKEIRKLTLELIFQSKSSHIGGGVLNGGAYRCSL